MNRVIVTLLALLFTMQVHAVSVIVIEQAQSNSGISGTNASNGFGQSITANSTSITKIGFKMYPYQSQDVDVTLSLQNSSGDTLASKNTTVSGSGGSQWIEVEFDSPVSTAIGDTYILHAEDTDGNKTYFANVNGMTSDVYSGGVFYNGTSPYSSSWDLTFRVYGEDTTAPTISGTTVASDNSTIAVTFSEAVYDTNAGSGSLEVGDFSLSISGGTATLSSATPSSISASGNVYTLGVSLSGTPDGDETITVVPSSSTAIYDAAGNAASTSQSNNTANLNDQATPTITGTTVASDNSTITVTFSEAVYDTNGGTGALEVGDFNIALSGGTKVLDSATPTAITSSGNAYTLTLDLSGNANGSETLTVTPVSNSIYDASGNAAATSQSNNTVTLNSDAIPTPLGKEDVKASVTAWTNTTSAWSAASIKAISNRLGWLSRHKGSVNTSHQGIKLTFNNKIIDAVMNTTPQSKEAIVGKLSKHIDPAKQAISLLSNTENALLAKSTEITSDAQMVAINEAARLRQNTIGSLNPTFKPVYDDWSMWTSGQITVGEVDATTSSSKQDSKDVAISLGFDKPFYDDGLVGWSLSVGQTKTDIGTSTTQVKSDNYGLSGYSVIKQDNGNTIESILGLGHLKFDTTRKDGSDTLTGKRDANQAFASVSIKNANATFEQDNWSITPYAKASASYTELDKFSESGASTALTYYKQTVNEAKVYVGADATYLVTLNNGTMTPFAKIEYGRDVSGGSKATMHYNSETTEYTLNLDKAAEEHWKLGIGTDIVTKDGWTGSVGYEREQAIGSGHSDSLKLDARLKF